MAQIYFKRDTQKKVRLKMADDKDKELLEDPDIRRIKKAVIDLQDRVDSLENQVKGLQELRDEIEKLKSQIKNIAEKLKEEGDEEDNLW